MFLQLCGAVRGCGRRDEPRVAKLTDRAELSCGVGYVWLGGVDSKVLVGHLCRRELQGGILVGQPDNPWSQIERQALANAALCLLFSQLADAGGTIDQLTEEVLSIWSSRGRLRRITRWPT